MNPLHFLIMYIWDVLNVNAKRMKSSLNSIQRCLIHVVLLQQQKNYQGRENPHTKTVAWSYDMDGHARKCVERYCELANNKWSSKTKFQVLAWMTIKSNKKNLNEWVNYHMCAHRLSQKGCTRHALEDQTFYGK